MRFLPPLDVLARLPLLPVMLWKGIRLRRHALVLPEAKGAREGVVGHGPNLSLLFVGDSSAAGVGVSQLNEALSGQLVKRLAKDNTVRWRLVARTGATTKTALRMLHAEPASSYDFALVALGVNDSARLTPEFLWRKRQAKLRRLLRDKFEARHILLTTVPPLRDFPALPPLLSWILGAHAERLAATLTHDTRGDDDVHLITFDMALTPDAMAEDGYHPNASSYALWADAAHRLITELRDAKAN